MNLLTDPWLMLERVEKLERENEYLIEQVRTLSARLHDSVRPSGVSPLSTAPRSGLRPRPPTPDSSSRTSVSSWRTWTSGK
jgi:hypothetical protein